eukprot:365219-Chlamydomonas_euryale.AAC.7
MVLINSKTVAQHVNFMGQHPASQHTQMISPISQVRHAPCDFAKSKGQTQVRESESELQGVDPRRVCLANSRRVIMVTEALRMSKED